MNPTIRIIWEFIVRPESIAEFERRYGADGDWANLFRRHSGYQGTTLLRDAANPCRFVTIDEWQTGADFFRMRESAAVEYSLLDASCAALTESERELGTFEPA